MTDLCKCPHCGKMMQTDLCDDGHKLVTLWGDDLVDYECPHCEKEVTLIENVTRWWEVYNERPEVGK